MSKKKHLMFPTILKRCYHRKYEYINIGAGSITLKYCLDCGALKWSFYDKWKLPKLMETYLK